MGNCYLYKHGIYELPHKLPNDKTISSQFPIPPPAPAPPPKKMNPHRPDAPAIPQRNRKAHKDSAPTPKTRSHPPGKIPRANFHEIAKFGLMYAKIPQTSKHILKSSGPNLDKIDQIVGELFTQWIFLKEILQNLRKIAWAYHEVPTFQASLLPNLGKCEKFLTRGFFSKTRPKPCWPTCVSL